LPFLSQTDFLVLPGVSGQDAVSQSPLSVTVGEKDEVLLSCSTTVSNQVLQWYRQYPKQALKHLVSGKTGEQQNKRITATMNYREKGSNLSITGTEVTDAATYLSGNSPLVHHSNYLLPHSISLLTVSYNLPGTILQLHHQRSLNAPCR
uniref:Ig-like domain-containing protein n=1 Tax=Callorhinchus milii TaxID=7868 RepID=A0A4W3HGX0_CALMI